MAKQAAEPQVLEEPGTGTEDEDQNIWMRGLFMIILAILFGLGETVLAIGAVIQFIWMLVKGEKNQPIADFGEEMADWLARVARFQTGSTEEKPFPFTKWGPEEA
ncbi:MAG: DUF4389 domain-containing protein [Rhodobacteraceae bacterium]|nr:DUF4389 domain-containing protein [Paracoccaceae bacterium]